MLERPLVTRPEKLRLAIEAAQPLLAIEQRELSIGRSLPVAFERPQLMGLLGSHPAKDFPVRLGRARQC
jgi:hypothetical protein